MTNFGFIVIHSEMNITLLFPSCSHVLEPESVSLTSTDKLVHYVGDSATLTGCQFVANFTNGLSVSWLKNGTVFEETSFNSSWNSHSFLISVDTLHLSNLDFSDSGNYSCQLTYNKTTNTNTIESSSVALIVQSRFFF